MLTTILKALGRPGGSALNLRWVKRGGWLGRTLRETVPPAPRKRTIEAIADATNALGAQRLAAEYGEPGATRTPAVVRSASYSGDLYAWLVQRRRPSIIVEFGSAFGVSGMYFVAGLDAVQHGRLYTFELNGDWAAIAERNIRSVSGRFTLTRGAFEDHVDVVPAAIELALVDAIHTREFVLQQFAILKPRLANGAIVAFDDIDFKNPGARMREAWEEIAADPAVVAAVEVRGRLGLVELA
jgi:predicted O-methyltransferase YrrM